MKKEELDLAKRYKQVSYKLSIGLTIFVIILGSIIFGVGLFLLVYFLTQMLIILGSIMMVVGIFDIILAIKFYRVTKRRIANMSDEEARRRYERIHGIEKK